MSDKYYELKKHFCFKFFLDLTLPLLLIHIYVLCIYRRKSYGLSYPQLCMSSRVLVPIPCPDLTTSKTVHALDMMVKMCPFALIFLQVKNNIPNSREQTNSIMDILNSYLFIMKYTRVSILIKCITLHLNEHASIEGERNQLPSPFP